MRRSRFNLVVLVVSLVPVGLLAQQLTPAPVASDPQAVSILNSARSALGQTALPGGGIAASGEFESIATGSIQPLSIDVISPMSYKIQVGLGASSYTWISNEGQVSVVTGTQSRSLPYPIVFADRCALIPTYGTTFDSSVGRVSLSGVADGTPVSASNPILNFEYHLPVVNDNDIVYTKQIEVDSRSLLPVRLMEWNRNEGNPEVSSQTEYIYADYRVEGSLMLPHTIQIRIDGQNNAIVTLKSFVIGAGLDSSTFTTR